MKYNIEPMKEPDNIIKYWTRDKKVLIGIIFFGLIYNVGLVFGPIYQGKLIDGLQIGKSTRDVIFIAIQFVSAILIVQICRYFKRLYIRRFANNTSAEMRFMLYNSLLYKSRKELNNENSGDIMAKAISDVSTCTEGMRKFSTEVFDTGIFMISYLVIMIIYDVKTTILSCLFIPIAMYIAERLKVVIYKYTSSYRKQVSRFSEYTYEYIDNALLYRVYGMDKTNEKIYSNELKELKRSAIYSEIWGGSLQPMYDMISMIGVVMVIYLGGMNVYDGKWTVGIFSTYITMFIQVAFKASKTSKLFNSVQKSFISWKRIKPYLEEYKEHGTVDKSLINSGQDIELDIRNLSFSYDGIKNILNDISFNVKSGMIIGITGQISCGKSTLGRIFLGGYDYKGSIKINGKELREIDNINRSSLISYMGHNSNLITDSIYNNITLGGSDNVDEIIKDVCFDIDLKSMKDGLETVVGNGGVRLSGGQQSRIALARCLYKNTPIMILDDPFSAIDIETEENIIENIRARNKNYIIILISHRLSSFKYANNIILMHNDGSYECGSEEELLYKSKLYRNLYELQLNKDKEKSDE